MLVMGREWELSLMHRGIVNELMGLRGNANVASHSRISLLGMC